MGETGSTSSGPDQSLRSFLGRASHSRPAGLQRPLSGFPRVPSGLARALDKLATSASSRATRAIRRLNEELQVACVGRAGAGHASASAKPGISRVSHAERADTKSSSSAASSASTVHLSCAATLCSAVTSKFGRSTDSSVSRSSSGIASATSAPERVSWGRIWKINLADVVHPKPLSVKLRFQIRPQLAPPTCRPTARNLKNPLSAL